MSDKPTTVPPFVINSSDDVNLTSSSTSNSFLSSTRFSEMEDCEEEEETDDEQESMEANCSRGSALVSANQSVQRFDFLKTPRKRKTNADIFFDRFNTTITKFMEEQKKTDEVFLKMLKGDEDPDVGEFILKIREGGEQSFIECELKEKTLSSLLNLISEEFCLPEENIAVLRKLPNVLIRNDKDVNRLKSNTEIEFITHGNIIITNTQR